MGLPSDTAAQIEELEGQFDQVLAIDWTGLDAEELAYQLRQYRKEIDRLKGLYQVEMRKLQQQRSEAKKAI